MSALSVKVMTRGVGVILRVVKVERIVPRLKHYCEALKIPVRVAINSKGSVPLIDEARMILRAGGIVMRSVAFAEVKKVVRTQPVFLVKLVLKYSSVEGFRRDLISI